jgi:hypothetical protein
MMLWMKTMALVLRFWYTLSLVSQLDPIGLHAILVIMSVLILKATNILYMTPVGLICSLSNIYYELCNGNWIENLSCINRTPCVFRTQKLEHSTLLMVPLVQKWLAFWYSVADFSLSPRAYVLGLFSSTHLDHPNADNFPAPCTNYKIRYNCVCSKFFFSYILEKYHRIRLAQIL